MGDQQRTVGDGRWTLGCQARPWMLALGQETFPKRLPEVMAEIAAIGFTGFETRLDHLPLDDPDGFAAASARANGLALCGAHVGGTWWAPEGEERIPAIVAQARRLPALGCQRLVVSMTPLPSDATDARLRRMTDTLERLGQSCREVGGVEIVLHNHAGELANDARVLQMIVERCTPDAVSLGPDLDWVAHTGTDARAFLRRFASRTTYLHLRDVTAHGPTGQWTEVGRGILDFPAILRTLAALEYRGWLVVESESAQEHGATEARETAVAQFDGVQAALNAAGLAS